MLKRKFIAAATVALALTGAACGAPGSESVGFSGRGGYAVPGGGPGGTSLWTHDSPYAPKVPVEEPAEQQAPPCEPGDNSQWTPKCPYSEPPPSFDESTGPGSHSLSLSG